MSTELIDSLIKSRNDTWQTLNDVVKGAEARGEWTGAEENAYTRLSADLDKFDKRIDDIRNHEVRAAKLDEQRADLEKIVRPTADEKTQRDAGENAHLRSEVILPTFREYRALSEGTDSAGGFLVPPQHIDGWFDILRAKNVVLKAGPIILPATSDEVHVPKIATSTAANMIAEGAAITEVEPTFGEIVLRPKKASALTIVSNEALEDSHPDLRRVMAHEHLAIVGSTLDKQFLEGSGAGVNMRGIRNFSGVTVTSLGANGAAPTLDNVEGALQRLEADNAEGIAIFMHPRTWSTFRKLKDLDERYQLQPDPTSESRKQLFGVPVHISSQINIAETEGISTDCSYIAVVDMSQIVIARRKAIEVKYSQDFKFGNDQTAIRTIARFDIGLVNDKAVELITGVRP